MSAQQITTTQENTVGFMTTGNFELSQRVAKMLSMSTIVPKEYQNNVANCAVALNMAARIKSDPLMTMQNLIIIHGRPTWSSQFLIATFNTCGRFSSLRYEFFGDKTKDDYGCRATAIELSTGEKLVGTDVTIAIAKSEGWFQKNGSKWKTMPQQMLMYRAAAWFIRAIAPEISMGLHTQEEVVDAVLVEEVKKTRSRSVDDLINAANNEPVIEEAQFVDVPLEQPALQEEVTPEVTPVDPYAPWIEKINQCQTISDIAWILKEIPPQIKADLKEHIGIIQDEIKAAQNAMQVQEEMA